MKQGELQKEIDGFHARIKARALSIAFRWAGGSAPVLAKAAKVKPTTPNVWAIRQEIPASAALRLERVPGFPLSATEMRPDVNWIANHARLPRNTKRMPKKGPRYCTGSPLSPKERAQSTPDISESYADLV